MSCLIPVSIDKGNPQRRPSHGEREKIVIYTIIIIYNTVQTHMKKTNIHSHRNSPNLKEKENETKITESVREGMVKSLGIEQTETQYGIIKYIHKTVQTVQGTEADVKFKLK